MAKQNISTTQTVFTFIQAQIAKKTVMLRLGTARTYGNCLRSFSTFRTGEDIIFDELTTDLIDTYEAWLKNKGLKRNTISCYLRTLRTLYRKAVEAGLAANNDIFRHSSTGIAKTRKRAISIPYITAMTRLDLPHGSSIALARDLFLLSIYLRGMSFVDMAFLKRSDIKNGVVTYIRKKTQQSLSIEWNDSMQAIVDKYAKQTKDSPFLLPIITKQDGTERKQYEMMEQKVNRRLKKIATMIGLNMPLTTYVARHTWASTAQEMGCHMSIIKEGMGHDNIKTTQIYLASIDNSAVDRANEKIISMIQEGKIIK